MVFSHYYRHRVVTPHTNLQKPRPPGHASAKKNITPLEKRELFRQKLIRRSKNHRLKVKAMVHHVPTDHDIAELLTEFTVDFLLKGFSNLVSTVRKNILISETQSTQNLHMEQSHYMWLVTYFLKFSAQVNKQCRLFLDISTKTQGQKNSSRKKIRQSFPKNSDK